MTGDPNSAAFPRHIHLRSDNCSPVLPEIRQAILDDLLEAQEEGAGLAYDRLLDDPLRAAFETMFGRPVTVAVTASGTGSNAVAIASLAEARQPRVACHATAHVVAWEEQAVLRLAGAPAFDLLDGDNGKISDSELDRYLASKPRDELAGGVLTITNPTEVGTLYAVDDIARLTARAHRDRLAVHLDGARFAVSTVALCISPAEFVERTAIDGLSFGGTKVGALAADAVVLFRTDRAIGDRLARAQRAGGQRLAKRRFIQVQLLRLLESRLWLAVAGRQLQACAQFVEKLEPEVRSLLRYAPDTNQLFFKGDTARSAALAANGIGHTLWRVDTIRLVFHHALDAADVDAAAARVNLVLGTCGLGRSFLSCR